MGFKKVYLDIGHGGHDPGALGFGLKESEINLSVGLKVAKLLEYQNIDVMLSRAGDISKTLDARVKEANLYKANCFVSIHCNAASSSAKGVETFSYRASTNDLAKCVHNAIIDSKAYTTNRGLKTANFYVIKNTSMRSCLVELGFISNSEDNQILRTKQDILAEAIAKGICKYLGVEYKKPVTVAPSGRMYKVCVGAYLDKANAERQLDLAKKTGFKDAYITT